MRQPYDETLHLPAQRDAIVAKSCHADRQSAAGRQQSPQPSPSRWAPASRLLAAAFIHDHQVRLYAIFASSTVALLVFGAVGAALGGASLWRGAARVVTGGWLVSPPRERHPVPVLGWT